MMAASRRPDFVDGPARNCINFRCFVLDKTDQLSLWAKGHLIFPFVFSRFSKRRFNVPKNQKVEFVTKGGPVYARLFCISTAFAGACPQRIPYYLVPTPPKSVRRNLDVHIPASNTLTKHTHKSSKMDTQQQHITTLSTAFTLNIQCILIHEDIMGGQRFRQRRQDRALCSTYI